LATTVETPLLAFDAKAEAACASLATGEPPPREEMLDGIARARGARAERLGARGSGVEADADGDDEDEARPPQEAAAAARAAIVFLLTLSLPEQ
jgi:hypothetical protein